MAINKDLSLEQFNTDMEVEAPNVMIRARDINYCHYECEYEEDCPLNSPGATFGGTLHIYKGDYEHIVKSLPEDTHCLAHDDFSGAYHSTIGYSEKIERRWLEITYGGKFHVVPFSKFDLISDLGVLKYDLIDGHVFRPIGTTPELPRTPGVKRVSKKEFLSNLNNLTEK